MTAFSPDDLPRRVSLVAETARALREGIQSGTWGEYLPGERELCSHLQVSRPTLRSALLELQKDGILRAESRRRRRIIAAGGNPNEKPQTGVIGAISPRPLSLMPQSAIIVIDGLRTAWERAGLRFEIVVDPLCYSRKPDRALERLVAATRADAWVMFGSREPMQRWFSSKNLSSLVLGSNPGEILIPSVDIDYRAVCRHAGGILRSYGHRSISLILPDSATGGEADSEIGFLEALENFEDTRAGIIRHDGTAAGLIVKLENALRSDEHPTALIVGRGVHALTVMTFLQRSRISVPGQISVIARDNEEYLEHVTPEIARYSINPSRITRSVVRTIREMIESEFATVRHTRLMPDFIQGETLATPED
ncbi:MAG: substrate-binding domain-containing protein [Verrucomicrobiales bacterium]|nr:substrate-binding domain-containing protein [Verrucomicrobiales bacterium]